MAKLQKTLNVITLSSFVWHNTEKREQMVVWWWMYVRTIFSSEERAPAEDVGTVGVHQ